MASRGINKVIIVGNLGDDPTIRYTQNNVAIANLSIATSESWKDKQTGEQKELTEWHRVVLHRRLAEIAGEYLKKGSKVYIEGQLRKNGLNRRAAIQRCCRRLRAQTKSKRLYELFTGLISSNNAVAVVEGIYANMVKEGLL